MNEVLDQAIRMVNLPFTILLGLIVLYWVLVGLGALDAHLFSDFDSHLDGSTSLETGAHHEVDHDVPTFSHLLHFAGGGDVPLMVVLSVLGVLMWLGSMLSNYYLAGGSVLFSLGMLIPIFAASVVATRYLTYPLRPLFRLINKERGAGEEVLGRVCQIVTSEATPTFGQAEILRSGAPVLINVRTLDDAVLPKGAKAAVVRTDSNKGVYYITQMPDAELPQLKPHN